jgi:uncharacterized Fe-S center protein
VKSRVYFADLRTHPRESLPTKIGRLLDRAGISKTVGDRDLVALKMHFGERGNTAHIRPALARAVAERVRERGAQPFFTDTNTLYVGGRADAVQHLRTAEANGFVPAVVGAPVIIADGLRGVEEILVTIPGKHFQQVRIAALFAHADSILSLAHFKGHELSGFGGAIKNIAMGCAARGGKLAMHSTVKPEVQEKKCTGCWRCLAFCPSGAIQQIKERASGSREVSRIATEVCVGCGGCVVVCPQGAIRISWDETVEVFQEKMVEYVLGVHRLRQGRLGYLNFLLDISPACDCYPNSDAPLVGDIGIVASLDPVAIDQASCDLVTGAEGNRGSVLGEQGRAGQDKLRLVYPHIDWAVQLKYAESLGLGSRDYELVTI